MKSTIVTQEQLEASLLPSSEDNSVIYALKTLGLYIKPINGNHLITCPWIEEHTKGRESTIYFEPTTKFPYGGFNCPHHHCIDRSVKHLKAYLVKAIADLEARAE